MTKFLALLMLTCNVLSASVTNSDLVVTNEDIILFGNLIAVREIAIENKQEVYQLVLKLEKQYGFSSQMVYSDELLVHFSRSPTDSLTYNIGEKLLIIGHEIDGRYWGKNLETSLFKVIKYGKKDYLMNMTKQIVSFKIFESKLLTNNIELKAIFNKNDFEILDQPQNQYLGNTNQARDVASTGQLQVLGRKSPFSAEFWIVVLLTILGVSHKLIRHLNTDESDV